MTSPRSAKRFPATTLAQLLLLMLFVGLALGTWLRTKTSAEIRQAGLEVSICKDSTLAAIAAPNRVDVMDWSTGKTVLTLGPRDLPALSPRTPQSPTAWYRWPDSHYSVFTPNLDVDFRQGYFGSNAPTDNGALFWDMQRGSNPTPRCLFTEDGKAIALEATSTEGQRFDFLIIDLASGKRTFISRPWKSFNYLQDQMEIRGDRIVLPMTKDKQITLIDPATGAATTAPEEPKTTPKSPTTGLPLTVTDKDGAKGQIDSHFGPSGMSLLLRRGENAAPESKRSAPIALVSWKQLPSIYWQSPKNALCIHDGENGANRRPFFEGSPNWLLSDAPPWVSRAPWPFADGNALTNLYVTDDRRGATATRRQRLGESMMVKLTPVYWDINAARTAPILKDAWRSQQIGDLLLVESPARLQSLDLATGKSPFERALDRQSGPPLALAWCIWLLAWTRWGRRQGTEDASRLYGLLAAALFLGAIGFAWAKPSAELAWLLPSLLLIAGAIVLMVLVIRRSASIAALLVFGVLNLSLLVSSLHLGFSADPAMSAPGRPTSPASLLKNKITSDSKTLAPSLARHWDYFTAAWRGPTRIDFPGPHTLEDPH